MVSPIMPQCLAVTITRWSTDLDSIISYVANYAGKAFLNISKNFIDKNIQFVQFSMQAPSPYFRDFFDHLYGGDATRFRMDM